MVERNLMSGAGGGLGCDPDRSPPLPEKFPPPPFRCEVEHADGAARLRPHGELDMASVPKLERLLRQAHDDGYREMIVDLRGLEFMDSTGLSLLVRWSLCADRDGYDFALVAGDDKIHRLFELTGLTSHFTFVDG
jgi:anti-sigma B factor antagonist